MMKEYETEEFVKAFFGRTKHVLEQYDQMVQSKPEWLDAYETTLLCNCLVGLLVFPEQKFYDFIKNRMLSKENLHRLRSCIVHQNTKQSDLCCILRRMRNAVSHQNVRFVGGSKGEIQSIAFYDDQKWEDKKKKGDDLSTYEFQLVIEPDVLKPILIEFCENVIERRK